MHQLHTCNRMTSAQQGFSLVEVILASSLFVLIVTTFVGSYLYGQESTALSGSRARAVLLANEGLEAVQNIRNADFANLVNGTYGLDVSGGQWIFSGTSDSVDIFTREIIITTVDADTKSIRSDVTWQQNPQRAGLVSATTYMTHWMQALAQNQNLAVSTSSASIAGGGDKELQGVTLENIGTTDIVIDKITVTWDNGNLIQEVKIDNTKVWRHNNEGTPDGKQPSGTELDIEDFTLVAGGGVLGIDKFKFDGDMAGTVFTIVFTLDDSTTVQVTIDLSGGGSACGTQSDDFTIDVSGANIAGGGEKELRGVSVTSTDTSCDVTITKATLTWTNGQDIEEIKIDGTRIWKHNNEGSPNGKQPTGTEIDVVDYVISGGSTSTFNKFKFDGDMDSNVFTILFEMGDGSTESSGNFAP